MIALIASRLPQQGCAGVGVRFGDRSEHGLAQPLGHAAIDCARSPRELISAPGRGTGLRHGALPAISLYAHVTKMSTP